MHNKILELTKKQTTIAIADSPLLLGGKVKHITIDEFEKIIGQSYLDRIDARESPVYLSDTYENIRGNLTSRQLKKQLESLFSNPRQDLVICKNDPVGYGVFASNDIPKDTLLCFYSGTLINCDQVKIDTDYAIEYYGLNTSFSTRYFRGIASFFQHFPTALKCPDAKIFSQWLQVMGQVVSENDLKLNEELYSVEFLDKGIEQSLAIANVRCEYVCYNGNPVILFVTDSEIKAGEQIGFNYGKDYWLSRNLVPEFFNKSGGIIPYSSYRRTFAQLKLDGSVFTGDLLPLVNQLETGKSQIELVDDNRKVKKINPSIVLKELLRVRAITEEQYHVFKHSIPHLSNSLFKTTEINYLIKKYNLPDSSQLSLEKGLRNAANKNQLSDLKKFIPLVKNINAEDPNPITRRTALHWAAIKGHEECCQLLLESGASHSISDALGETADKYLKSSLNKTI